MIRTNRKQRTKRILDINAMPQGLLNTVRPKRRNANKRNIITTSTLPKMVMKNLFSQRKYITLKNVYTLQSINTSNLVTQASTSQFVNIGAFLSSNSTFNDLVPIYRFWRITGVKLEVQRTIADNSVSSVYSNGVLPTLYMLFAPFSTSTNPSTSTEQSSVAFQIDPFITEKQRVSYTFSPFYAFTNAGGGQTAGETFIYGGWNILNATYFPSTPGQIQWVNNGNGNAIATQNLFSLTILLDIELACDVLQSM